MSRTRCTLAAWSRTHFADFHKSGSACGSPFVGEISRFWGGGAFLLKKTAGLSGCWPVCCLGSNRRDLRGFGQRTLTLTVIIRQPAQLHRDRKSISPTKVRSWLADRLRVELEATSSPMPPKRNVLQTNSVRAESMIRELGHSLGPHRFRQPVSCR